MDEGCKSGRRARRQSGGQRWIAYAGVDGVATFQFLTSSQQGVAVPHLAFHLLFGTSLQDVTCVHMSRETMREDIIKLFLCFVVGIAFSRLCVLRSFLPADGRRLLGRSCLMVSARFPDVGGRRAGATESVRELPYLAKPVTASL